jgi:hypothetical protein
MEALSKLYERCLPTRHPKSRRRAHHNSQELDQFLIDRRMGPIIANQIYLSSKGISYQPTAPLSLQT